LEDKSILPVPDRGGGDGQGRREKGRRWAGGRRRTEGCRLPLMTCASRDLGEQIRRSKGVWDPWRRRLARWWPALVVVMAAAGVDDGADPREIDRRVRLFDGEWPNGVRDRS
jgi:hypothetical protein